mgnify:CR=1 FL=1
MCVDLCVCMGLLWSGEFLFHVYCGVVILGQWAFVSPPLTRMRSNRYMASRLGILIDAGMMGFHTYLIRLDGGREGMYGYTYFKPCFFFVVSASSFY